MTLQQTTEMQSHEHEHVLSSPPVTSYLEQYLISSDMIRMVDKTMNKHYNKIPWCQKLNPEKRRCRSGLQRKRFKGAGELSYTCLFGIVCA